MLFRIIPRRSIDKIDSEFRALLKKLDYNLISEFESSFAAYISCKNAIIVPSAGIGMRLILESLDLQEGDEIIVPAYTLEALIGIIVSLGFKAIPADIDRYSFNITPESILEKITFKTKVIIATHMFGNPCEIDRIVKIAKKRSIIVLEDCAHSLGSSFNGRKTGSFGKASFFSFDTIKTINTYGGGMVVTEDSVLYAKMRSNTLNNKFKNSIPYNKILFSFLEDKFSKTFMFLPVLYLLASSWGNKSVYNLYRKIQSIVSSGNNYTDYQAYLGSVKLNALESRITKREKMFELLQRYLRKDIILQRIESNEKSNHYFLVLISKVRAEEVRLKLLRYGIDAGIKSEIADNCAQILGFSDCPNAARLYDYGVQIPFYENMTTLDMIYMAKTVNSIL